MINFPDTPALGEAFGPFIWDGVKWTTPVVSSGGPASDALPLMAGVASPGLVEAYSRGDHQHPIDSSRAPTVSPVFSGGLGTDTIYTSGPVSATTIATYNGRLVAQMHGASDQPGICLYSINRGWAMGAFLDVNNCIAFGGMDGNGFPNSNVARFDTLGNMYLNGTIVLGRDPVNWNDVATKQYVDARNYGGAYLPLTGGQMSGQFTSAQAWTGVGTAGGVGTVEVRSGDAGSDAFMSFHWMGAFACNFGLSGSEFWFGGWSHGWTAYKFWSTQHFGGFPSSNARMPHAADLFQANSTGLVESWGGAVITGMTGPSGFGVEYTTRWRYMQLFTTGWYTIGYA
jgi:hypothetical protein